MINASFLSNGCVIQKYRNSRSISFNQSSHALPVLIWSSSGTKGRALRFLVCVITYAGHAWAASPSCPDSLAGIAIALAASCKRVTR